LGLGLAKGGVMDAQKRTEATKVQDRPVFESIRAYIEAEKNKTRLVGSDEFKSFVAAYSEMGRLKKFRTAMAAIEKRVFDMPMEKYERDELEYYFGIIKDQ
jgi:hypothetical protein